jgi:hypothetical protein
MDRTPPTHIELSLDDLDDDTTIDALPGNEWFDEKTAQIDFERPTLSAEVKLVAGYLTLEEHDMFGHLSLEEQQQIVNTLKR